MSSLTGDAKTNTTITINIKKYS